MRKIAVLASGSGTLAEAIFEAVDKKVLPCTVSALVCDKEDALVIERARKRQIPVYLHPMSQDRQQWNLELLHYLQSLNLDSGSQRWLYANSRSLGYFLTSDYQ
jgi:phosphoribosylglycinamide formyltransferase 1